jgi:hypothetical protein
VEIFQCHGILEFVRRLADEFSATSRREYLATIRQKTAAFEHII